MDKKNYRIPIFVPHLGCPHDCVFCNQKRITGQTREVGAEDVKKITDEYLNTLPKDSYIEIAFFGGSFTGIEFEKQTELLSAAYEYVKSGKVQGIRCSTRPDCIDRKIIENLKKYGVTCIELGVQSTDDEVLHLSGRGHSFEDVVNASKLINEYKISLGLQMMLGLPGDSFEKSFKTARDLIEQNPECVRIYPTLVVKDTALWDMYEKGDYTPLGVDEAAEWLAGIIPEFIKNNIKVIRVGLQTTGEINETTVKGPYHPSIREIAESKIILKTIEKYILQNKVKNEPEICCNPKNISKVLGQERCNLNYLKTKYGARILQDNSLSLSELKICGKVIEIYG